MTDKHSLLDTLHEASHRIPGVPAHAERPAGHQGNVRHGGPVRAATAERHSSAGNANHSPARPPRVLVAWQRRVAALFGRAL